MKKIKILLLIGTMVNFLFGMSQIVYGEEIYTESYHVNMHVRENRSYDISERIHLNFSYPMHGISRYIPMLETKGSVLPDGEIELTDSFSSVKVNQIKVGNQSYTVKNQDKHKVILIGEEQQLLLGNQEYTINYTWNPGKNHDKNYDQVLYEIIPQKWNRSIETASFEIELPKKISKEDVYFEFGSPTNSTVNYRIEGNKLFGAVDGGLSSNTGLTFYVRLPKGYFNNETAGSRYNLFILFVLIWLFYGATRYSTKLTFGKKVKEIPTSTPPNNLSPTELIYIKQGKLMSRNVVVTILDFAIRGCIRYEQTNEEEFTLYKLREVHSLSPRFEKNLMNALFEGGKNEVSSLDLRYNFHIRLNNAQNAAEREIDKQGFMLSRKVENGRLVLSCFLFLSTFLTSIVIHLSSTNFLSIGDIVMNIFIGIALFIPFHLTASNIRSKNQQSRVRFKVKKWLLGIFSTLIILSIMITGLANQENSWLFLIALGLVIYIMFLSSKATRLSEENYQLRCEILGFQMFLSNINKSDLIRLSKENERYCYDMLPYAQVFGVTKDYLKVLEKEKFELLEWQFLTKEGIRYQPNDYAEALKKSMNLLEKVLTSAKNNTTSGGGSNSDYYSDSSSWTGGGDTSTSTSDGGGGVW